MRKCGNSGGFTDFVALNSCTQLTISVRAQSTTICQGKVPGKVQVFVLKVLSFSFDNHLQVVNFWISLLVFLNLNWFLSKRFIAESHICERLATRFLPVFREKGISKNFSISLSITTLNVSRFLSRENSHKQYESYQIGCFRPSLAVIFHHSTSFLRLFLCCFFLQVVQIASNSHRKHALRAYM